MKNATLTIIKSFKKYINAIEYIHHFCKLIFVVCQKITAGTCYEFHIIFYKPAENNSFLDNYLFSYFEYGKI